MKDLLDVGGISVHPDNTAEITLKLADGDLKLRSSTAKLNDFALRMIAAMQHQGPRLERPKPRRGTSYAVYVPEGSKTVVLAALQPTTGGDTHRIQFPLKADIAKQLGENMIAAAQQATGSQ